MANEKILIVDDDRSVFQLAQTVLKSRYDLCHVDNLRDAERELNQSTYDLVLLDVVFPDGDGFEFAEKIRELNDSKLNDVTLVFLTVKSEVANKVRGFRLGCTDYIVKPFLPEELLARVECRIRENKHKQNSQQKITRGDLIIDKQKLAVQMVTASGSRNIPMTPTEFKILVFLVCDMDKTFTREEILGAVWSNAEISMRTIDRHIALLREKIKDSSVRIVSAHGVGYRAIVDTNRDYE